MDYLFFSIGLIVALVAGFILARKLAPNAGADTGADEQKTILETQNSELKTQLTEAKNRADKLQENLSITQQQNARLTADKTHAETQLVEHKNNVAQMGVQFENVANKILDEKNKKFNEQSQKDITNLLTPFKDQFQQFQTVVKDSFGTQAKEQFALKEEIKRVVEVHESMTLQTRGLTDALKGDSKTQGNWGEVMLEKILDDSGLRKGQDYIVQGAGMGLKESETGKSQRPDVVIHLPDNKHVIIDSKVSLTHYEGFCSAETAEEKSQYLAQFLRSVKKHVTDLQDRGYEHIDKLESPDFVLMFMPIEGAYALAVQSDTELHRYAWDKKIVIVCPSTLFATLKTIASIWRLELQNKHAVEIARQGGELYDKVVGFIEDMDAIGSQLGKVQKTYDGAMNKLSTGRGNIIGKTEKLKTLGAKAKKSMPTEFLNDENGAVADLPQPDPEH